MGGRVARPDWERGVGVQEVLSCKFIHQRLAGKQVYNASKVV